MKQAAFWHRNRPLWISLGVIFLLGAAAFLPFLGQLGFYRDDWHVLWSSSTGGVWAVFREHVIDRPFMGLLYGITVRLLGYSPAAWTVYAFVLRFISAGAFYVLFGLIFPDRKQYSLWAGGLFFVYPGFLEQPNASMFQMHIAAYMLAVLSITLSVAAIKEARKGRRWLWVVLATGLTFLYPLIYEYMIGLELLRLCLIVYVLRQQQARWPRVKSIFLNVLPYAAAAGLFLVWRLFIFRSTRSVTDVSSLKGMYLADPFGSLLRLGIEFLKDVWESVVLAWGVPLYNLTNSGSANQIALGLIIASAGGGLLWFVSTRLQTLDENQIAIKTTVGERALLGLIGVAAALMPILISNRHVQFQDLYDRYTLSTTLGGIFLLTAALELMPTFKIRSVLVAVLTGSALLTHFMNGIYFSDLWEYQRQLWWQLTWRAPDLKDTTTLVPLLPPGYRLMEGYEVWGPANLIYRPDDSRLSISGETLNNQTLLPLMDGYAVQRTFRNNDLLIEFKNALVMSLPAGGGCLRVMDGAHPELGSSEEPVLRMAARYSNPDLILPEAEQKTPPREIFGPEPEHGWCYYYEKASLARQQKDWDEVVRLGDEVRALGLQPADVVEWMPFYAGYAARGRYDEANELGGWIRQDAGFTNDWCRAYDEQTRKSGGYLIINLCQ